MQENNVFANLISPIGIEDFFQNYFEKQFLHIKRDSSDYYHHILNTKDLDIYFQTRNLRHDYLRVVKDGADCPSDDWTKIEKRNNTEPYRLVVIEKLFGLFNDGATIIINAAQTAIPSIASFCSSLEYELKTCVQPNIYITPPNEQGFTPHFDPHDVFILQISGSKEWCLFDAPFPLPVTAQSISEHHYETKEPKQVITMQPGDMLYMPRGTVHFAKSKDAASIHITVGLLSRYWFNLLENLVEIAKEDSDFRKMIPLGLQSEEAEEKFLEEFENKLKVLISKTDAKILLERNHEKFVENHLIDRKDYFTNLLQVDEINLDTKVSRRTDIEYLIEKNEQEVCIKFGVEKMLLPHFALSSLELFLQDKPFAVREIHGLISDSGKLDLVKKFVKAGFLKIDSI